MAVHQKQPSISWGAVLNRVQQWSVGRRERGLNATIHSIFIYLPGIIYWNINYCQRLCPNNEFNKFNMSAPYFDNVIVNIRSSSSRRRNANGWWSRVAPYRVWLARLKILRIYTHSHNNKCFVGRGCG